MKAKAPAFKQMRSSAFRVLYLLMDFGRAEWWAYGTLVAWCVLVPAGFWASGQAVTSAMAWRTAIESSNKVPTLRHKPLGEAEMTRIAQTLRLTYQDMTVVSAQGLLTVTAKTPDQYSDWLAMVSLLPSLQKGALWSIKELCVNGEAAKCHGGALSVVVAVERLEVIAAPTPPPN